MTDFPVVSTSPSVTAHAAAESLPPLGSALNVLLVWPRVPASFWSFAGMMAMLPQASLHPPLGLITIAALCPPTWNCRLIDRSFEALHDADLRWADLVMVSGMRVQHEDMHATLQRARALGKRTMVGGPYASSQPEALLPLADHVIVGEPDEVFGDIAADLERGTARPLYVIEARPDVSHTPVPRFDLLRLDKYASMEVQFSRGCPFQCEFCDIITIYGRKPRTKSTAQMLREFDTLYALGWRGRIFVVDDNFIGNHRKALQLAEALATWQQERQVPFTLSTEASMDLAQHPELIDAMVAANFWSVFMGIESPSREALSETKKFQNLRQDPLECVQCIQQRGLWVTAGFIVGFDADSEDIFARQAAFIEQAAIPWAMTGFLVALPTTPLYDRMQREGRLLPEDRMQGQFKPPNFRTIIPLPDLLQGGKALLEQIYAPDAFYERAFRSIEAWQASPQQQAPRQSPAYMLRVLARSVLHQGLLSSYRRAYWQFFRRIFQHWRRQPQKRWLGLTVLLSGHHFIRYTQEVVAELTTELRTCAADEPVHAA
ncbi:MAG: B12-binding domain-containing radical SAM protein [Candidatus Tectimicrobiota bacterium]